MVRLRALARACAPRDAGGGQERSRPGGAFQPGFAGARSLSSALVGSLAPEAALGRTDARFLAAAPPRVFAAIHQVRPDELPGYSLVRRLTPFDAERPLYAQMLGAGYTVLGTMPLREVLLGRVGHLARPFAAEPRVKDKRAFLEFSRRGHVKILLGFQLAAERRGSRSGTLVTATLHVWDAVDPESPRLRLAWPGLGWVGGRVARSFLEALERRAAV